MKASTTLHPETILSCAERLRRHATKARPPLAADLRLAAAYCRRLASIAIFDQAAGEKDHARKRDLEREATELWGRCHGSV